LGLDVVRLIEAATLSIDRDGSTINIDAVRIESGLVA
jgi:hypothetical protein